MQRLLEKCPECEKFPLELVLDRQGITMRAAAALADWSKGVALISMGDKLGIAYYLTPEDMSAPTIEWANNVGDLVARAARVDAVVGLDLPHLTMCAKAHAATFS